MNTDTRVDNYLRQDGGHVVLTPAQVRRANHKLHRANRHGEHVHTPGERCVTCSPAPRPPEPDPVPFRPYGPLLFSGRMAGKRAQSGGA